MILKVFTMADGVEWTGTSDENENFILGQSIKESR